MPSEPSPRQPSDPSPDPDAAGSRASPPNHHPPERASAWLQNRLQAELERWELNGGLAPSLTIIGMRPAGVDLLGHGFDKTEEAILGFTLPPRYEAMGVVAASVVEMPPGRWHRDAGLAIGADRHGALVSMIATADEVTHTSQPTGWLADACLRAVGLPTAPTSLSPLVLPLALWLDRLMVALVNADLDRPLSWSDAAALCPIPRRWRSTDPVDLGATLGSTTRSWKALRRVASHGDYSPVDVAPGVASWMDDSMFARWCVGMFPDLASLQADVEFLAPPLVAENIEIAQRAAWLAMTDER